MNKPKNFIQWIDRFPPFVIFALARKSRGVALTLEEISSSSGLPLRTVGRLSPKTTWKKEKAETIEAFCRGCNFDIMRPRKQIDFIRRTALAKRKFCHLSISRRKIFEKRIVQWQKSLKENEINSKS